MNRMPKCHPSFAQYAALGLLNISARDFLIWMKKMHRPSNLYILVHITEANHFIFLEWGNRRYLSCSKEWYAGDWINLQRVKSIWHEKKNNEIWKMIIKHTKWGRRVNGFKLVSSRDSCAAGTGGSHGKMAVRSAIFANTRTSSRKCPWDSVEVSIGKRSEPCLERTDASSPQLPRRQVQQTVVVWPTPESPKVSQRRPRRHSSSCTCPVSWQNRKKNSQKFEKFGKKIVSAIYWHFREVCTWNVEKKTTHLNDGFPCHPADG